jgi:hypothetical protein
VEDVRRWATAAEGASLPPSNRDEYVGGYGLMGLPFSSGHILAMRRFFVSSFGPEYTSVWHRDPAGSWTIYADVPPLDGCARYFGNDLDGAVNTPVNLEWTDADAFRVTMPAFDFTWTATMSSSAATRVMNVASSAMPEALWRNRPTLTAMSRVAGLLLGAGRVGLRGRAPNGQWFIANPRRIWTVASSRATFGEQDLGLPAPLEEQASLGDFLIPQRGIFAIGNSLFEPLNEAKHELTATRPA